VVQVDQFLDAAFGIYRGENKNIILMPSFEHKLSNYLVSKFVLKYSIKAWTMSSPCFLLVYVVTVDCI